MIRLGARRSRSNARRRWPGALVATALLGTVVVWSAGDSEAQTASPFTIDVSKTTDLVSGESIEINLRTPEGTVVYPAATSEVRTCKVQATYTEGQFDNVGAPGTCVVNRTPISSFDNSLDDNQFFRFPDAGAEHGRRAITVLRPGQGTANWLQAGVQQSLECGPDDPCRLVFRVRYQTGTAAPVTVIQAGPELSYRPSTGVAGCSGAATGAIESTMPDRLQDVWLNWTRTVCQTKNVPAPTNAFFQDEGNALESFASGTYDLAYSAVGYRSGFDAPQRRPMVATPVALDAVVVAVGGGYLVDDGSWPPTLPRPTGEFRLTNAELATLVGQFEGAYLAKYSADVVARNPQVLSDFYLSNSNAAAPIAVTGPQSTTLFASNFFDTLAPAQWTDREGTPRGIETDLNDAKPTHSGGAMDLKTGRPDLARIVYKNLFELGTYYVLTDLATADALGLTPVTLQNAAGEWVKPTPETMAAAVPGMQRQDDGTLLPNPSTAAGYPLTYVEYAMAPAQPLVTAECAQRPASQELLTDWLAYATTDGQSQLAASGLVPLTPDLQAEAATQRAKVGASPTTGTCLGPPTTNPPGTTPTTGLPPASVTSPNGLGGSGDELASGSGSGAGSDDSVGGGGATPARQATPATKRQAVRAAREAEIELPDLLGIRSINHLLPPLALLLIVALSTIVVLATAGYPAPAALARLSAQLRRSFSQARSTLSRLVRRRTAPA